MLQRSYKYGRDYDRERLNNLCIKGGGQALCKLNKMPDGHLTSIDNAEVCDICHPLFSTITARYYKGIGSHKDNMVIEVEQIDE